MKLQFDEIISVKKIIKNVETPFYLLTDHKEDFGYLNFYKIRNVGIH